MKEDNIQISQILTLPRRSRLVSRSRKYAFKLEGGCWDCANTTLRYYSSAFGKRYYQCEKCRAVNH